MVLAIPIQANKHLSSKSLENSAMAAFSALVVLALFAQALARPSYMTETHNNPPQRGVLITEPPRPTFTGVKRIPGVLRRSLYFFCSP